MEKLFLISVASIMTLVACNNDEDGLNAPVDEGTTSITLSLNSGGDGFTTRAARPVESSEAYNTVDKVIVRVFSADGTEIVAAKKELNWTSGPVTPGSPGTTDHKASQTIEFPKSTFSQNTAYTIVAYGYDETDLGYDLTTTANYAENAWTASYKTGKTDVEELFAGVVAKTTGENKAFPDDTEVIMKRQIAGMLGYFKNIPVQYPNASNVLSPVKYVRVIASNESKKFTFPSISTDTRVNGIEPTNASTQVLEFDLPTLITDATAGAGNAYAQQLSAAQASGDPKAFFTINEVTTGSEGNPAKVANSVLGGKFLMPYSKTADPTFKIQLVGQDGSTILKTWEVVTNKDVDGTTAGSKVFDIKRNFFYSMGQKVKAGEIVPGGGTDPDEPVDLSKESIIEVTINDAWDVLYSLGIE